MKTYIIAILITDLILGVVPAKIAKKKVRIFGSGTYMEYLYFSSL